MVRASQREARLRHLRAEAVGIGEELLAQRIALFDQIENLQRRPAMAGISVLEKRYGRERWRSQSMTSRLPDV